MIEGAKTILASIGMPENRQNELCCRVLLALANKTKLNQWADVDNNWTGIHEILEFLDDEYGIKYAENSRETIRKQAIHSFQHAAIIEDNGKATNSPHFKYRLTADFWALVSAYDSAEWEATLESFLQNYTTLKELYASKKRMQKMDVMINHEDFSFSPGKHNLLQKAILEDFAPRFAPGSECLYVGDTIKKDLVKNVDKLQELGLEITLHDKMPDVVLYKEDSEWIYFIEAVTSVGPMDDKRMQELSEMTKNVSAGIVYVTAFLDRGSAFKKFFTDIAWETEIWIADNPDHMIHLNGDRFLGPR